MGHIFISYSHKDKAYVHRLQEALTKEGFEVWIDDRIDYGEEWPLEIEARLDGCDAFIVVVSDNSKRSKWVQNEVRRAERINKPFFPLLLQGEPWLMIETTQWFPVMGGTMPDEKFFRRLANFSKRRKTSVLSPSTYQPEPPPQRAPRREPVRFPYLQVGGVALGLIFLFFVMNYFSSGTAAPVQEETYTPKAPTETQIPPTFTLEPPTFTPTPGIGSFILSDDVTMMYVPEGTFSMGSEAYDNEKPVHSVELDAYYIDKFEVTNAAYKRCVSAGKCFPPKQANSNTRDAYFSNPEFADFPVIYVDWNMAKTYCEWRDARLPTEAEWEKAARGLDGRTYPWGEDISCDKANYQSSCVGDTTKVGSYLDGVSPYGLYDMAGNVWEWVNDWYDSSYYQSSPLSNPTGAVSGSSRVLRGGSWNDFVNNARSSNRNLSTPDFFNYLIGFRCARSLP